jgi:hypothetical protein
MRVQRRRLAALAAHELVDGHAGAFALDVPQRLVDAGQRVVEHRATAPVGADVGRLIDILDVVRAAAEEERLEILLDRGHHGQRALGEGGAAEAVQAGLARLDLDHDQAYAVGRGTDGLDTRDARRCHSGWWVRYHSRPHQTGSKEAMWRRTSCR